jgi:hypothetical protein
MKYVTTRNKPGSQSYKRPSPLKLDFVPDQGKSGIENIFAVEGAPPPCFCLRHHEKAIYRRFNRANSQFVDRACHLIDLNAIVI